jgi:hypothetical protein
VEIQMNRSTGSAAAGSRVEPQRQTIPGARAAVNRIGRALPLAVVLLLAGCVVLPPSGPSLGALPGSRMSYERFQHDDQLCRQHALAQVGGRGATESAQESAAASAIAGTLIGAAVGGALGGSDAAAVGAGFGLLTGALVGADTAQASYHAVQRNYDAAYYACMYAKGHRVPVSGGYTQAARAAPPPRPAGPPADAGIPPPNAPPPPSAGAPPPNAGIPPANAPPPAGAPYVPPYWPPR